MQTNNDKHPTLAELRRDVIASALVIIAVSVTTFAVITFLDWMWPT